MRKYFHAHLIDLKRFVQRLASTVDQQRWPDNNYNHQLQTKIYSHSEPPENVCKKILYEIEKNLAERNTILLKNRFIV